MHLSHERITFILQWINKRMAGRCPACHGGQFDFHHVMEMTIAGTQETRTYVPISCSDCAYTFLLSDFYLEELEKRGAGK